MTRIVTFKLAGRSEAEEVAINPDMVTQVRRSGGEDNCRIFLVNEENSVAVEGSLQQVIHALRAG